MLNDIGGALETAVAEWMAAHDDVPPGYAVVAALRQGAKAVKDIVVHCPDGRPLALGVNLFEVPVQVMISTQANDNDGAEHQVAVDAAVDILTDSEAPGDITAGEKVVVSGITLSGVIRRPENVDFVTVIETMVTCSWGSAA